MMVRVFDTLDSTWDASLTIVLAGGTWKPLTPPVQDSLGQPFECTGAVSEH